jgi:sugar (pentulose or hexulose) kinase
MELFATPGYDFLDDLLQPEDPEPLLFVPGTEDSWTGDVLFGITLSSGGIHLVRALCQGIAFHYRSQLVADEEPSRAEFLYVCGGVFEHFRFCQILAHVFNTPVVTLREGAVQKLMPLLVSDEGAQIAFLEALRKFRRLPPHDPEPALHARYLHHYKRYSSLKRDTILYNEE